MSLFRLDLGKQLDKQSPKINEKFYFKAEVTLTTSFYVCAYVIDSRKRIKLHLKKVEEKLKYQKRAQSVRIEKKLWDISNFKRKSFEE